MKLTYKTQLYLTFIIVLLANILSDIFSFWLYRSIGWVFCGLLHILHPVVPKGMEKNKKAVLCIRIAGVILILIGVFTRVHYS